MRPIAVLTARSQSGPERAPSAYVTWPWGSGGRRRRGVRVLGGRAPAATVVTHQRPARCPTTTSGTTSTPPAGERGENANEPKATGPVPGRPTSSRTAACRVNSAQAAPASAKRSSPEVRTVAALPQPMSPSPRRTQARAAERGSRPSSGPGSVRGTVRATRVAPARGDQLAVVIAIRVSKVVPGRRAGSLRSLSCHNSGMPRASLEKRPHEVAAMFDEVAARYDRTNDVLSLGQDRRWRRAVVEALDMRPGEKLLDLAAGTGTSAEPFADAGVLAVPCDFSLGMLRVGRRRRADLAFVAGDATRLPFADGAFDAVTISFGLRNVGDVDAALAEMRRVTRHGGTNAISEFLPPTWSPLRRIHTR